MSRPPRRPPPPRHTVAVEIAGEKHVLRSDVPPEYTRRVASHVDATIRALPGFQTLEPFRAATLAALSITDELLTARDEIRRLREEADERSHRLADLLEAAEQGTGDRGQGTAGRRRPAAASASAADTPPPLPETATPPATSSAAPLPPPSADPHPAWVAAPVEKPAPPPSLFGGDEPELNFPPPEE